MFEKRIQKATHKPIKSQKIRIKSKAKKGYSKKNIK
jgi:hypothetical protein